MSTEEEEAAQAAEGAEQVQEAAAVASAADTERRALEMGWRPKEKFAGPEHLWVDAETYLRRGEEVLPIVRKHNRELEQKLSRIEQELTESRTVAKHTWELAQAAETRAYDRAKRDFERERREAETRLEDAAKVADVAGVRAATQELAGLREPEPPRTPPAPTQPAPSAEEVSAVNSWKREEASWFDVDQDATAFAGALYGRLMGNGALSHQERLAQVKQSVQRRFPELFQNQARSAPGAVSSPSGASGAPQRRSKDWTWEDIPPADREIAERTVRELNRPLQGKKPAKEYTKADYLRTYFDGQTKGA